MDDERLEWALRRLPGVLACSLDSDAVTLLLDPHASAIDIEAAANSLLLGSGDTRAPVLLGGTRPVVVARSRIDLAPVVRAAAPGVIAIGAAALVATLVASPAAFWRDAVTPTPDAPTAISPPARHRIAPGQHATDAAVVGSANAVATSGTEAIAAAAPTRRLVLLVPPLPASLTGTLAVQPISSVMLTTTATPKASVHPPRPSHPASTSVLAIDETAAVAAQQESASLTDGDKHDGKHGEKDALGHGQKGWGHTRSRQVRSGRSQAAGRGVALAHGARHHGDED